MTRYFRKTTFSRLMTMMLLVWGLGVMAADEVPAPSVELQIASGIGEDLQPHDDLKKISMRQQRVFVYMKWHDLPVGKKYLICTEPLAVAYKTELFDGKGALVSSDMHRITATRPDDVSWLQHDFKPGKEAPGTWRVKQHAYGQVVETSFQVTP